jgi:hypothetical protein
MDSLREKLAKLRLKVVSQHLEQVLKEAKDKNLSILAVLQRLADLELEYRWQAAIKLRFTQSRLPESLTIDQFRNVSMILRHPGQEITVATVRSEPPLQVD